MLWLDSIDKAKLTPTGRGIHREKGLSKGSAALLWPHLSMTAVGQASRYLSSPNYGNLSPFLSSGKALQEVWMGWGDDTLFIVGSWRKEASGQQSVLPRMFECGEVVSMETA